MFFKRCLNSVIVTLSLTPGYTHDFVCSGKFFRIFLSGSWRVVGVEFFHNFKCTKIITGRAGQQSVKMFAFTGHHFGDHMCHHTEHRSPV